MFKILGAKNRRKNLHKYSGPPFQIRGGPGSFSIAIICHSYFCIETKNYNRLPKDTQTNSNHPQSNWQNLTLTLTSIESNVFTTFSTNSDRNTACLSNFLSILVSDISSHFSPGLFTNFLLILIQGVIR